MKKYLTIVPMILILVLFTCIKAMAQEPQPIDGRPWTTIIPDPDTYDWSNNNRPGYRYRGMEPMHQRFHDYIKRKQAQGTELHWEERLLIRQLIAARRWPEAPRPNEFWAAYMRYLRSLPNDKLNTAQTLMLTELTRRGLVGLDRDPSPAASRIREYLNSKPFEARNWFERTFGRVEDWMGPWLDYQLAGHGHPLSAPGAVAQFPIIAWIRGAMYPASMGASVASDERHVIVKPWDYQLEYSISGCCDPQSRHVYKLGKPNDPALGELSPVVELLNGVPTQIAYRVGSVVNYYGTFKPGTTLTISGRVRVGSVGAEVFANAVADKKINEMTFKVPPQKEPSWHPFQVTVPVPEGTKAASLRVYMEWPREDYSNSLMPPNLTVSAQLTPDPDTLATYAGDEAWAKYVNETLARLGYSDTPLGRDLKRMRDALAGTDADWKRYVNEEQRRLGYDSSPEAVAYYELNEAAQAGGEKWAAYINRKEAIKPGDETGPKAEELKKKAESLLSRGDLQEAEEAIGELEKIDAAAATALNKKLASEFVNQGWEACRMDYDYEKGIPLLERASSLDPENVDARNKLELVRKAKLVMAQMLALVPKCEEHLAAKRVWSAYEVLREIDRLDNFGMPKGLTGPNPPKKRLSELHSQLLREYNIFMRDNRAQFRSCCDRKDWKGAVDLTREALELEHMPATRKELETSLAFAQMNLDKPPEDDPPLKPPDILKAGTTYSGEVKSSQSQGTRPFELTINSFSGQKFTGRIHWPLLSSIHEIKGTYSEKALSFKETAVIQAGSARLNGEYVLQQIENRYVGTWQDLVSSENGDVFLNISVPEQEHSSWQVFTFPAAGGVGCWVFLSDGRLIGYRDLDSLKNKSSVWQGSWTMDSNGYHCTVTYQGVISEFWVRMSTDGASFEAFERDNTGSNKKFRTGKRLGSPQKTERDLTGTWEWYQSGIVTFRSDGTLVQGSLTGRWTLEGNVAKLQWSHGYYDTLTLSEDGNELKGFGSSDPNATSGYSVWARRISISQDVIGPGEQNTVSSTGVVKEAALVPGWDIFNVPLQGGKVRWSTSDAGGGQLVFRATFELSGAQPNHSYTVGAHFFEPQGQRLPDVNQFGGLKLGSGRGAITRVGQTATCIGCFDFGKLVTDGKGNGSASFKYTVPAAVYYLHFNVRVGECDPGRGVTAGCGVVFWTGGKFGGDFKVISGK
ncbi:tetratricopeptide repeat protein [Acidobacteriota bacterium]